MSDLPAILGVLTGLATIVLSLGIAFWFIYWPYRHKRLQYDERRLMIEKGLTPPPVPPEEVKRVTPQDALRRGVVLLFLGAGLGIAAGVAGMAVEEELAGVLGIAAAIVASLGAGNLAYYFIARRKFSETPDAERMPM